MNKQNLKKHYFKYLLAIYFIAALLVIISLILDAFKGSAAAGKSAIPTIETARLDKTFETIKAREALSYPEKTDLSDYEFGKAEPFQ